LHGPSSQEVLESLERCACVLLLNHQTDESHSLELRAYAIRRTLENRPLDKEFFSGGVLQGKAIFRAEPVYPVAAKHAGISGTVVMEVTIDEEGNVIDTKMRCGNDIFAAESLAAARRWRFAPTTLNGRPVKVIGSITFNFKI
jgi:TonB family protein